MKQKTQNILNLIKNHRILSMFIISLLITSSIVIIGFISILSPLFSIPDFFLSSFRIVRVDEGFVYADFTFNLTSQAEHEISVKKITIKLFQENIEEKMILADGYTCEPFIIKQNADSIENISFIFEIHAIEFLLKTLLEEEKVGIMGRIFFPFGFSIPFNYKPKSIGIGILPSMKILEVHPIPPGSILEVLVEIYNPHDIILNLTQGSFNLIASEYGYLGNVSLTDISISPRFSNITFHLQMNSQEMKWLFERILNNGSLLAEIQNFNAKIDFGGEDLNISLEKTLFFTWGHSDPSLDFLEFGNVSYSLTDQLLSFDISLGVFGNPLWGYNISSKSENQSSIYCEFFHSFNDNSQKVGNGSTDKTFYVRRNEITNLNIHITILPATAVGMILIWISENKIEIDIRNGNLSLQFYEVILQIGFERKVNA